jgi:threonine dehydrogenase-like Zn-dependent dehydrogenase
MSTGLGGAQSGRIAIGDTVAVFAQGPIGLCAAAGAKLLGATTVIGVDRVPARLDVARRLGADIVVDFSKVDPVEEIMRLTDGRGVDVAIEALGTQATFESCLRVLRPGGVLSSLGVYSTDLRIPLNAFAAGLGDHTIVTTLCPGGKERMRRLMSVIASRRVDLGPLVTHRFKLDDIEAAYELFANQRDGVLKVAITP